MFPELFLLGAELLLLFTERLLLPSEFLLRREKGLGSLDRGLVADNVFLMVAAEPDVGALNLVPVGPGVGKVLHVT